jgi:hypothetical protein
MRSAPSVPGAEVGASWLGGCEHALTAGALELLAVLHGTLGPGRAELPASRAVRDAELTGGRGPNYRPGRGTCGRATGGWPSVKAGRPDATSLTRWTGRGTPVWPSTGTARFDP